MNDETRQRDGSQSSSHAQRNRFAEAARELGADEDEAAFKEKLAVIARQRVKDEVPKPPDKASNEAE